MNYVSENGIIVLPDPEEFILVLLLLLNKVTHKVIVFCFLFVPRTG